MCIGLAVSKSDFSGWLFSMRPWFFPFCFITVNCWVLYCADKRHLGNQNALGKRGKYDVPGDLEGAFFQVPEVSQCKQHFYAHHVNCPHNFRCDSHPLLSSHKGDCYQYVYSINLSILARLFTLAVLCLSNVHACSWVVHFSHLRLRLSYLQPGAQVCM